MEVIPRLYAHSKYTHYLPAVVYGSCTMAVVTPQFAQWADVVYVVYATGDAFDLYSSHLIILWLSMMYNVMYLLQSV